MRNKAFLAAVMLILVGCGNSKQKALEKQKEIDQAKAARKESKDLYEKAAQAASKAETVKLDPFWMDPSYIKVAPDGACPEGLWSLFPGDAPGKDPAEKKENAGRRAELAKKMKDATYAVHLVPPGGVKLGDFDPPRGSFPLEVSGAIDCTDSFGHLTLAWNQAKAITPGNSAAKDGAEVQQSIWEATSTFLNVPMKSAAEAKTFMDGHRFDLAARVVFKLGRTEVHKKMFKTSAVEAAGVKMGGGSEDWGAGRLIHVELLGLRVGTNHEQTVISEQKKK